MEGDMGKKELAPNRQHTNKFKGESVRWAESIGGNQAAKRRCTEAFQKAIFCTVVVIILTACHVGGMYRDTVDLPEGTNAQTAYELVEHISKNHFFEKITAKFPTLDSSSRIGLARLVLTPLAGGKEKVCIVLYIRYTGKLDNAKEIIDYGKTIVEQQVKEYFEKRPGAYSRVENGQEDLAANSTRCG